MQVILLTPPETLPHELETINAAFHFGLGRLHVRKPNFSDDDYFTYLQQIPSKWHKQIVIHGARHLFHKMSLGGVHFNSHERQLQTGKIDEQPYPSHLVSSSFHTWEEVATADTQRYGRLFISPLFNSISKQGYMAATTAGGIVDVVNIFESNRPEIIGLGGINAQNIKTLQNLKYDGAAVMGAVWTAPKPLDALVEIIDKIS